MDVFFDDLFPKNGNVGMDEQVGSTRQFLANTDQLESGRWLKCDGRLLERTQYPELGNVLQSEVMDVPLIAALKDSAVYDYTDSDIAPLMGPAPGSGSITIGSAVTHNKRLIKLISTTLYSFDLYRPGSDYIVLATNVLAYYVLGDTLYYNNGSSVTRYSLTSNTVISTFSETNLNKATVLVVGANESIIAGIRSGVVYVSHDGGITTTSFTSIVINGVSSTVEYLVVVNSILSVITRISSTERRVYRYNTVLKNWSLDTTLTTSIVSASAVLAARLESEYVALTYVGFSVLWSLSTGWTVMMAQASNYTDIPPFKYGNKYYVYRNSIGFIATTLRESTDLSNWIASTEDNPLMNFLQSFTVPNTTRTHLVMNTSDDDYPLIIYDTSLLTAIEIPSNSTRNIRMRSSYETNLMWPGSSTVIPKVSQLVPDPTRDTNYYIEDNKVFLANRNKAGLELLRIFPASVRVGCVEPDTGVLLVAWDAASLTTPSNFGTYDARTQQWTDFTLANQFEIGTGTGNSSLNILDIIWHPERNYFLAFAHRYNSSSQYGAALFKATLNDLSTKGWTQIGGIINYTNLTNSLDRDFFNYRLNKVGLRFKLVDNIPLIFQTMSLFGQPADGSAVVGFFYGEDPTDGNPSTFNLSVFNTSALTSLFNNGNQRLQLLDLVPIRLQDGRRVLEALCSGALTTNGWGSEFLRSGLIFFETTAEGKVTNISFKTTNPYVFNIQTFRNTQTQISWCQYLASNSRAPKAIRSISHILGTLNGLKNSDNVSIDNPTPVGSRFKLGLRFNEKTLVATDISDGTQQSVTVDRYSKGYFDLERPDLNYPLKNQYMGLPVWGSNQWIVPLSNASWLTVSAVNINTQDYLSLPSVETTPEGLNSYIKVKS